MRNYDIMTSLNLRFMLVFTFYFHLLSIQRNVDSVKKENLFIIMLNNDYVDIYLFSLRSWCLGLRSFFYRSSKMLRQLREISYVACIEKLIITPPYLFNIYISHFFLIRNSFDCERNGDIQNIFHCCTASDFHLFIAWSHCSTCMA